MTESEAIARIRDHFEVHNDNRPHPYLDEAVEMAIQALGAMLIVNAQPTAYDVDKVVEQLKEKIDDIGFIRATPEANAYIKGINDAIEIVKSGGTQ